MTPNKFIELYNTITAPPPTSSLTPICQFMQQEPLDLFVTDEILNKPVDILYPFIALHIENCSICCHEYERRATDNYLVAGF
ncbi:MAG TPA: hypothetical protein VLL52_20575 [Anaerolineae bacterium]|nr:hypothetical protein [Anaerolineae bacterium]